ncbi:hypothetical protein CI102_10199 [Trichoderma harzianum]|nr:hypothetical protein CI102_10199 [Trichoderma harzianum]
MPAKTRDIKTTAAATAPYNHVGSITCYFFSQSAFSRSLSSVSFLCRFCLCLSIVSFDCRFCLSLLSVAFVCLSLSSIYRLHHFPHHFPLLFIFISPTLAVLPPYSP